MPIVSIPFNVDAQIPRSVPASGLRFITELSNIEFFYVDRINRNTGIQLAPIDELKEFEFEIADTTIPAKSLGQLLQIDLYLRQRYSGA